MIELASPADPDDGFPEALRKKGAGETRREDAETALARTALDIALTRRMRAVLKKHPGVFILTVAETEWVSVISEYVRSMARAPVVVPVTELKKSGGVRCRAGRDELAMLQDGHSVMFVTHDPKGLLDETVFATADLSVTLPPLTPALLRKTIRRATGGVARGVSDQMARLSLDIVLASIRPGLRAGVCVANLQRALERKNTAPSANVPRLDQLPLTGPVRSWSDQLLRDLEAVEAGSLQPEQVPYIALEGPPGTGKTLIANSLAATSGWTFVPTSVGGWFSTGDGALGGVARNLKSFVDQVLASEPAIGFLDELDALPDRETMDNRGRDWWTPVITLFLTEIDRLRKSGRKVLLIGATNYYERLDSALIRPGRLQQRVSVLPPATEDEVLAVLRYWLGDDLAGTDIGKLGRLGLGATPAAVEGWVKQARAIARSENRALAVSDLVTQMTPKDNRSPADLRAVAIHEIGHALVAHRLGQTVDMVTIVPSGSAGGFTRTGLPTIVPTRQVLEDIVTVALGGRAADMVVGTGANAGAESDLAHATELLLNAHESQGLGDTLVSRRVAQRGIRPESLLAAVDDDLRRLLDRAVAIIAQERDAVLALADRLIDDRIMSGAELTAVLGAKPEDRPTPAPRARHGGACSSPWISKRSQKPSPGGSGKI